MDDKQAMGIIQEVAEIGTQTIRREKWLKKNWRFVAICLTVLLCVAMVCGTVYGIVCHLSTLDTLKEVVYSTETVVESTTTTKTAEADNGGVATVGNNNSITTGGDR